MSRYFYNKDDDGTSDFDRSENFNSADGYSSSADEISAHQLRAAISATRQFFFDHQHPDGYWMAELEGDARLQSETILTLAFLGEESSDLAKACAVELLQSQFEDGGWGCYYGSSSDLCNTVKAYFALKLTGQDPGTEAMQRARIRVMELGGADGVDVLTRFFLAVLGQVPHEICPVVPPQIMLLPKWFSFDIYSLSAWIRTLFIPLSIISAMAPVRKITLEKGIQELFVKAPKHWKISGVSLEKNVSITNLRLCVAGFLARTARKLRFTPFRRRSIEQAKQWILDHCRQSDGPGATHHSIIWSWIALKTLEFEDDSPEIRYCRDQLEELVIWNRDRTQARVQPAKTPVLDSSLTLKALMVGGLTTSHPAVKKGVQWIRSRHIKEKGDWSRSVTVEPGGWCREFNNSFYPDCDDTAMALMILAGRFDEARTATPKIASRGKLTLRSLEEKPAPESGPLSGVLPPDLRLLAGESVESLDDAKQMALDMADTSNALESGLRWLLAMQNKDGGWAAFDRNNNPPKKSSVSKSRMRSAAQLPDSPFKENLNRESIAACYTLTDPSTSDLTGRVLESLGRLGFRIGQNAEIDQAVSFLRKQQNPDGSWFGRWGVNYIYGTWQVLMGLSAVGISKSDPMVLSAANWLLSHQDSSGGWGESTGSYDDTLLRGRGTPTASQTSWAVMGLIAAGKLNDPAVVRGIRFLLDHQRENGTWFERESTGTALPGLYYLKYHYYAVYFPLMALSSYAAGIKVANLSACESGVSLKMHKIHIFSSEPSSCDHERPNEEMEERMKSTARTLDCSRFRIFLG